MRLQKVIYTNIVISILIISFIGCTKKKSIEISEPIHEKVNKEEFTSIKVGEINDYEGKKIEVQGTVNYVKYVGEDLQFSINNLDYDTFEEEEITCIWRNTDDDATSELKKDIEYAKASDGNEILRVYGVVNSKYEVDVQDIHYIGKSLGGISIWGSEAHQYKGFTEIYNETYKGYYNDKIEESKANLEEKSYTTDESMYLDVSCYEAINKIPLETLIKINGSADNIFYDGYNNIYFTLRDNSDSVECFWYNNDKEKLGKYKDILEEVERNASEVTVYGVYKDNPKDVGEFNIYIYDIKLNESTIESNFNISSDNSNENQEIIVSDIERYKPTGVQIYISRDKDAYGRTTGLCKYIVYYDEVIGVDQYYLVYTDKKGKIGRVELNGSPDEFYALEYKEAYVIGLKDEISSLSSDITTFSN